MINRSRSRQLAMQTALSVCLCFWLDASAEEPEQLPPVTEADIRRLASLEDEADNGVSKTKELTALQAIIRLRTRLQGEHHWATHESKVRYDVIVREWEFETQEQTLQKSCEKELKDARLLRQTRNDTFAEPMFRKALAIRERLFGEQHLWTLAICDELAACLLGQGKLREAETLLRRVVSENEKSLTRLHPRTASNFHNLAICMRMQGKYEEAKRYAEGAVAARRKFVEPDNRLPVDAYLDDADTSKLLARSLLELGEIETQLSRESDDPKEADRLIQQAETDLRRAVELIEKDAAWSPAGMVQMFMGQRPKFTSRPAGFEQQWLHFPSPYLSVRYFVHLGENLYLQKRYREAYAHFRVAHRLQSLSAGMGESHSATLRTAHAVGVSMHAMQWFDEANPWLLRAYRIAQEHLKNEHPTTVALGNSLALNWYVRGEFGKAEAIAQEAADGFELARLRSALPGFQRSVLLARRSPYPLLACLLAKTDQPREAWHSLESHLGRGLLDDLSSRVWLPPEDRKRELELLRRLGELQLGVDREAKNETIQRQYEAVLAEFHEFETQLLQRELPASRVYELSYIQQQLTPESALLTWIDCPTRESEEQGGEHWACLVRSMGDPIWVPLLGSGPEHAWTAEDERLADLVFEDFRTKPDDAVAEWKPNTRRLYAQRIAPVLEHLQARGDLPAVRQLVVLPATKMAGIPIAPLFASADKDKDLSITYSPSGTLFAILQERQDQRRQSPSEKARLLVLGDPAFRSAKRLRGTQYELQVLSEMFPSEDVERLQGAEASFDNLQALADANRLQRFAFVFLATHAHANFRRPMLSHLILAGKEQDTQLTAMQMLTTWKLGAEVVALSACESGLGKRTDGEGYIGFSQALFLAGAQTVVLSSWKVDDGATALLMTRFYQNMLGQREGLSEPMPKGEALQEAQSWVRNMSLEQSRELLGDIPSLQRSLEKGPVGTTTAVRPFAHPNYWAGFRLIGDPSTLAVPIPRPAAESSSETVFWWMCGIGIVLGIGAGWILSRRTRSRSTDSPH